VDEALTGDGHEFLLKLSWLVVGPARGPGGRAEAAVSMRKVLVTP
jgi:hypothetical protein